MDPFKQFFINLFIKSGLDISRATLYTNDENIKYLLTAFTHPSGDPENNYETYEIYGDVVINTFVAFYILQKFPGITNSAWLAKLEHKLISGKTLAKLAHDNGLDKYIIYGKYKIKDIDMNEVIASNLDIYKNFAYYSMLEDVFEAMCSAIIKIVMVNGLSFAVGLQLVHNILKIFYDGLEIPLEYEKIFDAITRLKELYATEGLKWPFDKKTYYTEQLPDGTYLKRVYGGSDKRFLLGEAVAIMEEDAKEEASQKALKEIKKKYPNLEWPTPPDPYTPKENEVPPDQTQPPSFNEFLKNLLRMTSLKDTLIDKLAEDSRFKDIFKHNSYDSESNYIIYKFLGGYMLDMSVVYYIDWRFEGIVSPNWLSKIKHFLTNKKHLGIIFKEKGGTQYVKYGDSFEEHINEKKQYKFYQDVMKAFFGCLSLILMSPPYNLLYGLSISISNDLIRKLFNTIEIDLKYEVIFDPITRLKNIYERKDLKWPINQSYIIEKIDDKTGKVIDTNIKPTKGNEEPDEDDLPKEVEEHHYKIRVYGWPLNNRHYDRNDKYMNRVDLATIEGKIKDKTQKEAAKKALNTLSRRYNIMEIPLDPYTKIIKHEIKKSKTSRYV
jgi:dsRNA-specific ribonuclease